MFYTTEVSPEAELGPTLTVAITSSCRQNAPCRHVAAEHMLQCHTDFAGQPVDDSIYDCDRPNSDGRDQHHQHGAERPFQRYALVVAVVDIQQAAQQVGRSHQRAEQVKRLADQRGSCHFVGADAVVRGGLGEDRQHAEIEGVVGQHVGERHA